MKKSTIYLICTMLAVNFAAPGVAFGMPDKAGARVRDAAEVCANAAAASLLAEGTVVDSLSVAIEDAALPEVHDSIVRHPRFVFPVEDAPRDNVVPEAAVRQIGTVEAEPAWRGETLSTGGATQLVAEPGVRQRRHFLPMHRRIDRGINQGRFAYKGELAIGLSASYGTMSNDDTEFLVILENINLKGTIATVKPFIGYFYRDNRCLGVRFGYQHMSGRLGNVDLSLGDLNDVEFSFGNLELNSDSYSLALFHRSYVGLDRRGRFGLFAEVEASMQTGTTDFLNGEEGSATGTYSDNFKIKLAFNPGLAVYIFPNVCATVSLGLGGIQYASVTQRDGDGNHIGSRKASNMQFKINIFDINFGVVVHFWDKKKR